MARGKAAHHPAPIEPEEESQEMPEVEEDGEPEVAGRKGMNKSKAARAAIDAGYEKPVAAVAYIKRQFGIDMDPQRFSSIKSNYRKAQSEAKPGKAASAPAPGRKPATPVEGYVAPPPKQPDGGDLLDTLEALKPLLAQHGADKLKRMVDLLG